MLPWASSSYSFVEVITLRNFNLNNDNDKTIVKLLLIFQAHKRSSGQVGEETSLVQEMLRGALIFRNGTSPSVLSHLAVQIYFPYITASGTSTLTFLTY